jgi:hypothetical protein
MTIQRTGDHGLCINVPFSLGYSMLWDSFKCALRTARIVGTRSSIGQARIRNARSIAQLMISLTGKDQAISTLRSIARHVAMEVRP